MKTQNSNFSSYLDVLFLNRNKDYGAYLLRINYAKTALKALLFPLIIISAFSSYNSYHKASKKTILHNGSPIVNDSIVFIAVDIIPKVDDLEKNTNLLSQRKTKVFATPVIVNEKNNSTSKNVIIDSLGTADIAGVNANDTINNLPTDFENPFSNNKNGYGGYGNSFGVQDTAALMDPTIIYHKVDKKAVPPKGFMAFIKKHLRYPDLAKENGLAGKVVISFVIEKDGSLTNVTIDGRRLGGGLDEEALRVVSLLPKWEPAELKGQKIRSHFKLPIAFNLRDI